MLTVKQVAQRLGISRQMVYALCESGELSHHRIGKGRGCIRITEQDLADYVSQKRVAAIRERKKAPAPEPPLKHLKVNSSGKNPKRMCSPATASCCRSSAPSLSSTDSTRSR
jgi:excisionase family DNA binding protein